MGIGEMNEKKVWDVDPTQSDVEIGIEEFKEKSSKFFISEDFRSRLKAIDTVMDNLNLDYERFQNNLEKISLQMENLKLKSEISKRDMNVIRSKMAEQNEQKAEIAKQIGETYGIADIKKGSIDFVTGEWIPDGELINR
jgi:hypothetical protein